MNYLQEVKKNSNALSNEWLQIEDLYNKKLWHQLTLKIKELVQTKEMQVNEEAIKLYELFISDFEHRINTLSLVEICLHVYKQFKTSEQQINFLDRIRNKVKEQDVCAKLLCTITIGKILLLSLSSSSSIEEEEKEQRVRGVREGKGEEGLVSNLNNNNNNNRLIDLVKKIVEECDQELDKIDGITYVHAKYYELASDYYRTIGNHSKYYFSSLKYLGCINYNDENKLMKLHEKQEKAFFLSIAAILADDVYNFGELLMHPIIDTLKLQITNESTNIINSNNHLWLYELLFAFNSGDLNKFEQLKSYWSQLPDLQRAEIQMRKKLCLLCLMEMSFTKLNNTSSTNDNNNGGIVGGDGSGGDGGNSRQLSFKEIAQRVKLPTNEIELLVMRALSLDLIRGHIDQVDMKVYIQWIQPRVFDLNQIKQMRSRLDCWSNDIHKMITQIHENAHEILQ